MNDTKFQIAGWLTFSIGFLLSCIYSLPKEPNKFMFGTGAILCLAGLAFFRLKDFFSNETEEEISEEEQAKQQDGDVTKEGYIFNPETSLEHMIYFIKNIKKESDNSKIQDEIEKIQFYQITPFVQNRYRLSDEMGVEKFAMMFSFFATGERHINRAWSAIVDNYKNECFNSLEIALENFIDTKESFKRK